MFVALIRSKKKNNAKSIMRNATWGKASQRGIHTGEIFDIMLGALDLQQKIRL